MNERTLASSVPFRRETTRSRLFGPRKEGPSDRLTPRRPKLARHTSLRHSHTPHTAGSGHALVLPSGLRSQCTVSQTSFALVRIISVSLPPRK